jgi:hypothetical protein
LRERYLGIKGPLALAEVVEMSLVDASCQYIRIIGEPWPLIDDV